MAGYLETNAQIYLQVLITRHLDLRSAPVVVQPSDNSKKKKKFAE